MVRPAVDVEIIETSGADGRVIRKEVSKPAFRSAPAALESARAEAKSARDKAAEAMKAEVKEVNEEVTRVAGLIAAAR